ncbi:hypothetical protein BFJ71_g13743 [Fusarium oxysporum]|nr:hypothetical protein BFJ71_g13743 [Fusarium oxysporum]
MNPSTMYPIAHQSPFPFSINPSTIYPISDLLAQLSFPPVDDESRRPCCHQSWNLISVPLASSSHVLLVIGFKLLDLLVRAVKLQFRLTELLYADLAWCIGRICAVRPGSLARSDNKPANSPQKPFLIWKDIELSRDEQHGKFSARLHFRNLKTNYEDPEKSRGKTVQASTLTCIIKSPQNTENMVFSVPHRLLTMAVRRGILDGIETLDQLFSSEAKYISIKPEFLDKPVFLAASPRGLKVTEEPMRATALTKYVSLRGQKIGYSQDLTFYSFRRRAATDLTRKIGGDAARSLMNHDPDFRTLEKYYLSLEDTLDISGLALDEVDGDTGGHTEEMLKSGHDLAIHVLTDERARKIHGPALNALMSQMMLGGENYPALASAKELRNYKRVVRRAAIKALLAQEVQDQRHEMSQTDYNERVRRLERSRLGELVLKKARRNLAAPEPIDEGESPSDEPPTAVDETTGLFIHDVEELPEQDMDDQINNTGGHGVIHRELDEGEPEANEDIPYIEAAKAFMQLILSNTMSEYRNLRKNGVPCPQCQDDDTISQELKNKRYYDVTHLYDHERSKLHLPKQKWVRRVTQAFEASGEKRITCPYCKQLGKDSSFFHVKALVRHITYGSFGAEHDRLKRADGWYDDGWEKHPESKSKIFRKNQERQRQVKMAALNIRYSQYEPAPAPVPHPTRAGVVFAPGSRQITRAGVKMVSKDEIFKPQPIPGRYTSAIRVGDINEPFKIPKGLEGLIKTTRMKFPTIDPGQGAGGGKKGKEVEKEGLLRAKVEMNEVHHPVASNKSASSGV